ncbi:MAG TPA: SCO family protein [Steroidobacteraceae bacterium]|jgi:protein SCO1/2|nr:SCO family protein [Steroidobacteraceae bacterium]
MRRGTVLLWSLGGAAAVALGIMLAQLLAPASVSLAAGTWLPQPAPVSDFHLTDLSGHDFSLQSLRGHPALLLFGFTNCPDVCPLTLATLSQLPRATLPGLRVVFVSIDPQRDSRAVLQAYLAAFSPSFLGARGAQAQLAPLLRSLHVSVQREDLPDGSYTMQHSATLYLLNTHGQLAAVFTPPYSADALSMDLRRIATSDQL